MAIVVSCTAAPLPIVGLGMVERAVKARRHRPVVMVDLAVTREGPGVLYFTLAAEYLLPPTAASEQSHGLRVRRFFNFTTTDPARADTLAPGAEMTIEVQIEADSALRYAVLEDPLPAGYVVAPEAQPEYSYYGGYSRHYSRREVRDDKIVYFFDRLPAGRTTVRYKLRAETPGDFHVLPSIARLTYFPGIRGNSSLVKLKVEDTK